jgi:hypothetical protein
MLGELTLENLTWICFNCSTFKSSTRPLPLLLNKCITKDVLLTISEIANIGIRHAIDLLCNQPINPIHRFLALAICHRMFVEPKMNHYSWNYLESMHKIINLSTTIHHTKRKNMTKFRCKGGIRWNYCNLAYDWNMCALITQEDFIVKGSV